MLLSLLDLSLLDYWCRVTSVTCVTDVRHRGGFTLITHFIILINSNYQGRSLTLPLYIYTL
jgi:hypothetical protein